MTSDTTQVRLAFDSQVGPVRDHNEDDLRWFDPSENPVALRQKGRLYVVADGMGGHAAGEVASRIAVETIVDRYASDPDTDVGASLKRSIVDANAEIYRQAQSGERAGMGTTVVCAVIRGNELYVAHVGDSRAYLLRQGILRQLTEDHSFVAEQVRRGLLKEEEAEESSQRHVLSRALGKKPEVQADLSGPHDLKASDLLLLCSDGICGYLSNDQIQFALHANAQDPQSAVAGLMQLVDAARGQDNATAVVVLVESVVQAGRVAPVATAAAPRTEPMAAPRPQASGRAPHVGRAWFLWLPVFALIGALAGVVLSGTVGLSPLLRLRALGVGRTPAAALNRAADLLQGTPLPTTLPARYTVVVTATPVDTVAPSPSPSPSWTALPSATATATLTPTPTSTNVPTLTSTATPTEVSTATLTATSSVTLTLTPGPTATRSSTPWFGTTLVGPGASPSLPSAMATPTARH